MINQDLRLRVMTWNVWGHRYLRSERLPVIVRTLGATQADILALQEVWSGVGDQPGLTTILADSLKYHSNYTVAGEMDGTCIGNALLSRWPIVQSGKQLLPTDHSKKAEERVAAYAIVSSPYGNIPVITTHLSWERHLSDVRQEQTSALAQLATDLAVSEWPPLLLGDFNADPESDEIRMLTGRCSRSRNLVVFQDAWEQGGDGGRGFTWTPDNSYYEASRRLMLAAMPWLRRRLDYIFVGLPDGRRNDTLPVQVDRAWVERGIRENKLYGSDHYAVVADLVSHRLV